MMKKMKMTSFMTAGPYQRDDDSEHSLRSNTKKMKLAVIIVSYRPADCPKKFPILVS